MDPNADPSTAQQVESYIGDASDLALQWYHALNPTSTTAPVQPNTVTVSAAADPTIWIVLGVGAVAVILLLRK